MNGTFDRTHRYPVVMKLQTQIGGFSLCLLFHEFVGIEQTAFCAHLAMTYPMRFLTIATAISDAFAFTAL